MNSIHNTRTKRNQAGSTLVAALLVMGVLASLAAFTISRTSMHYRASFQSASWEEAFRASEAGADLTMASLNQLAINSTQAWAGWSAPDASGTRTRTYGPTTTPALPIHSGDGNTKLFVSLEATPILNGGRTWYRIRSRGTAEAPGSNAVTHEASLLSSTGVKNHKSMLRKVSFNTDSTGGALKLPQISRTIELIAKPSPARLFQRMLTTKNTITMSGGAFTDSFDSADSTKSTNGNYDLNKRQANGSVATNSKGNLSNLGDSTVMGNALSNGGILQKTRGVTGTVSNNFQTELPDPEKPQWTTMNLTPTVITGAVTLTAGTQANPARYKVSSIDLKSGDVLTIKNPTPGTTTYVEIWSTGDMSTNAQASFNMEPGVVAKFFVEGNFSIAGGAANNQSNNAANLLLYGITPTDGTSRQFKLTGSADFTGIIYCPGFDFVCTGGGNYQGCLVAKTAKLSGNAGYHFDESLATLDSDTIGGYQMTSWVEDIR